MILVSAFWIGTLSPVISRRAAAAACLLTLAVLTPACGSEDFPQTPPSPLVTAVPLDKDKQALEHARKATPHRLSEGIDFWFVAPRGFRDLPKDNPARKGLQSFWVRGQGKEADGIMVWAGAATGALGRGERAYRRASIKIFAPSVREVEVVKRKEEMDGHKVLHLRGLSKFGPATIDVLGVRVNDALYTVKFQLWAYHPQKERDAIIGQVMRSWHWGLED